MNIENAIGEEYTLFHFSWLKKKKEKVNNWEKTLYLPHPHFSCLTAEQHQIRPNQVLIRVYRERVWIVLSPAFFCFVFLVKIENSVHSRFLCSWFDSRWGGCLWLILKGRSIAANTVRLILLHMKTSSPRFCLFSQFLTFLEIILWGFVINLFLLFFFLKFERIYNDRWFSRRDVVVCW